MKEWLLLIGTLLEAVVVAAVAAFSGGLLACMVVCLVGGYCLACRDHNYRR